MTGQRQVPHVVALAGAAVESVAAPVTGSTIAAAVNRATMVLFIPFPPGCEDSGGLRTFKADEKLIGIARPKPGERMVFHRKGKAQGSGLGTMDA